MTENTSLSDKKESTLPAQGEQRPRLADQAGAWTSKHRDFFCGLPGELAFRNATTSMIAWVPTVTSFALTRALWEKYEQYAEKKPDAILTKVAKPLLGKEYPGGRMVGFIFGGWFTYRAVSKMIFRAHDRLFGAKTPEEGAQAIRSMPANLKQDVKEIVPGGLAEIVPGSLALALIPAAFLDQKTWRIKKGDFKQAKAGWLNNTLATGVAYSAFLEICDHIYPVVTKGKDYGDYYDKLKGLPPKETIPDDQKKFGFFTNDGAGRMLFRTVPSVMIGFAAYFAGQRWSYAKFGMPTKFGDNWKERGANWAKDYAAWAPTFTAYTVISQVYKHNYDKLFDRLEKKHAAQAQGTEPQTHAERVNNSRTDKVPAL